MRHYSDFNIPVKNATVALGKFDGMHIGHRAVIEELASFQKSVLISFVDSRRDVIYTETEKEHVLNGLGIENMVSISADMFENTGCETFVKKYLVDTLQTKTVIAGENHYRLGELESVCEKYGINVKVIPPVKNGTETITSEIIRTSLQNNVKEAIKLLGGSYVIAGPVIHGRGLGMKYGMPTANQYIAPNRLWPEYGVYASVVRLGERIFKGITNIGLRPSGDNTPIPSCETLILDFNEQIYGELMIIEVYAYIRPIKKFAGLKEVRIQIDKDIAQMETIQRTVAG
ncbi:MAG: riboflavin biosynthesis protein RibF, partial [Sphaerochaetaceae bacterium]|nr:riboflavin biosynthesis protein RibF [Sphaerochaetaceae bacterium]